MIFKYVLHIYIYHIQYRHHNNSTEMQSWPQGWHLLLHGRLLSIMLDLLAERMKGAETAKVGDPSDRKMVIISFFRR